MASHLDIANILCNRLRNKWNWIDSATRYSKHLMQQAQK